MEADFVHFDLGETWDQQVERELQGAAKYNKTYAVSALQVTDRRLGNAL